MQLTITGIYMRHGFRFSSAIEGARVLFRKTRHAAIGAVLVAATAAETHGQNVFCVVNEGKLEVVQRANRNRALVQENNQWVPYVDGPFTLRPATEYFPALITIHNRRFGKGGNAISDDGPSSVHLVQAGRFIYTADLEASSPLQNVVLVLVLGGRNDEDMFYVHEVNDMVPNRLERVSIDVITQYKLHGIHLKRTLLFSNGHEVFTSELPSVARERALDTLVAKRLDLSRDAKIQPLFAPDPVFPPKLKSSLKGDATVVFKVDAAGHVTEPSVTQAALPDFADAALEVIRQWRFVPATKAGVAVEARGAYTFHFELP